MMLSTVQLKFWRVQVLAGRGNRSNFFFAKMWELLGLGVVVGARKKGGGGGHSRCLGKPQNLMKYLKVLWAHNLRPQHHGVGYNSTALYLGNGLLDFVGQMVGNERYQLLTIM